MSKPTLVLATNNAHKVEEIRGILKRLLPQLDESTVVPMGDFDVPSVVEDGLSFEENATIKATAVTKATGLPALADDSGLVVDVMGEAPGILSARWAGHHGDDKANLDLLLGQMADVPKSGRTARFVCAAALAAPDQETVVKIGEMVGSIAMEAAGGGGFGYDPAFIPNGATITTAEMTAAEKNAISHRFHALEAIAPDLAAQLGL